MSQFQDGKERVIAYASRSLTLDERKLHSNVWEGIAVHWAITVKFRQYLIGMKFVLVTDNWTVACLTKCVKPSRRFTSMLMDLVEFDFSVRHLPARQNVVADHLSRVQSHTPPKHWLPLKKKTLNAAQFFKALLMAMPQPSSI